MIKQLSYTLTLAALILSSTAFADPEFGKPIVGKLILNKPERQVMPGFSSNPAPETKDVVLMNVKLNTQQRQAIVDFNPQASTHNQKQALMMATPEGSLPARVDRGMNGVPVLDQGMHGSCVTFASTAAVDALLGKGDYVSQLCSLELGAYFEQKAYLPSGWEGSYGPIVLNQIMGFGIINKTKQKEKSCGGLKEYPTSNGSNTGSAMTLDEFKETSENIGDNMFWDPLLTPHQRFAWNPNSSQDADNFLIKVKTALNDKNPRSDSRLTFASLIPVNYCSVGACGRHNAPNDTWALTDAIKNDRNPEMGGHEMVITGYDDDATAIDNEGKTHRGLLILRNSWSEYAGDRGTYYMTYDFFKKFVMEVQKVIIAK